LKSRTESNLEQSQQQHQEEEKWEDIEDDWVGKETQIIERMQQKKQSRAGRAYKPRKWD
jgi:hypothetical protein